MRRLRTPLALALTTLLVGGSMGATAATLITGKQVKDSSLTGADLKNSSITGSDLKDGSLSSKDLPTPLVQAINASSGTSFPVAGKDGANGRDGASGRDGANGKDGGAGTNGANGRDGAPGQSGRDAFGRLVYQRSPSIDNGAGDVSRGVVVCPDGMHAIGGGAYGELEQAGQSVVASSPAAANGDLDSRRWQVDMANTSTENSSFWVYAVCANAGEVSTG